MSGPFVPGTVLDPCVFFSEIVAELPPTSMLEEPHVIDVFLYCVVMFTFTREQVH